MKTLQNSPGELQFSTKKFQTGIQTKKLVCKIVKKTEKSIFFINLFTIIKNGYYSCMYLLKMM